MCAFVLYFALPTRCTYFDDFHANSVKCSSCQSKQTKITVKIGAFHESAHCTCTNCIWQEKHGKTKIKIMNFLLFISIIIAMRHFRAVTVALPSTAHKAKRNEETRRNAHKQNVFKSEKTTECIVNWQVHEIKLHFHAQGKIFFSSSAVCFPWSF